jgi:hypothetical protein
MFAKEILAENFAPSQWLSWPPSSLRVVDWNIDRGLRLRSIIDFLGDANADVFILQEVDINARRTHRLNIAQEIARKLRLNYVFGREFVELTQGSNTSPAYHGQATLSRWKISASRINPFPRTVQLLETALVHTNTGTVPGETRGKNCASFRDQHLWCFNGLLQPAPGEPCR